MEYRFGYGNQVYEAYAIIHGYKRIRIPSKLTRKPLMFPSLTVMKLWTFIHQKPNVIRSHVRAHWWWLTHFLKCSRIIYKAPHTRVDAYIGSHMSLFMIDLIYTIFFTLCNSIMRWIEWLSLPSTFYVSFIFLTLYCLLFPLLLHKQLYIQTSNNHYFITHYEHEIALRRRSIIKSRLA